MKKHTKIIIPVCKSRRNEPEEFFDLHSDHFQKMSTAGIPDVPATKIQVSLRI